MGSSKLEELPVWRHFMFSEKQNAVLAEFKS